MLKRVMFLALICACGADEGEEGESTQSVVGSGSGSQSSFDPCDPTPIDSRGTLPACLAGTSRGSAGPGKVAGAVIVPEPTPATEAVTATDRATQLSTERNPRAQDPVDRGFGPLKKAGAQ